ncbi:hypothetical protein Zmor_022224 [Zophobas morio]|uniref:Uncharacterized protein n=1 Tax=Zophobas morio TaxID=2755281 RepID=A0AA38M659_9CUCU|nr:hypothetical protein Zmor_022224 [Zophobas morio]
MFFFNENNKAESGYYLVFVIACKKAQQNQYGFSVVRRKRGGADCHDYIRELGKLRRELTSEPGRKSKEIFYYETVFVRSGEAQEARITGTVVASGLTITTNS